MIEKNHTFAWIDFYFRFKRELLRVCEQKGLIQPQRYVEELVVDDEDEDVLPDLVPT